MEKKQRFSLRKSKAYGVCSFLLGALLLAGPTQVSADDAEPGSSTPVVTVATDDLTTGEVDVNDVTDENSSSASTAATNTTDSTTVTTDAAPSNSTNDVSTDPSGDDTPLLPASAISTRDAGTDTTSPALTAPVTIFVDGTAKTFNPGDKLGLPTDWGRSDWHIRTYRKIFVGYSTSGTDAKTATTFYRDSDTIDTVIAKEGSMDGKALHAVFITQDQIFDFLDDIGTDSSKLAIGVNHDGEGSVTNADVKEEKGFTGKVDATDRLVTEYYESDKDKYTVSVDATFEWNKPYIPMLVAENPLSFIKSANGVTDFSGENPTNYTYEDLKVVLDSSIKTATTMNNLTLTSSLFTVAAVLDENYNVLPTTVTKPASDSNLTTFSFENPNSLTTFIVRTIVRNYGLREPASSIVEGSTVLTATGAEVTGPMILTSGDATNLYVDKETALAIAKDEQPVLKVNGNIGGSVALDKTNFTGAGALLALFMPNNLKIETNNSLNNLNLDFEFNYVKYDKNSIVFEPGVEQNLGTSAVVHNNPLDADELNSNTKPTAATEGDTHLGNLDNVTIDGKTYVFKGWNTQPDGSGQAFDGTTPVGEDITVYAIWEEKSQDYTIIVKVDGLEVSTDFYPNTTDEEFFNRISETSAKYKNLIDLGMDIEGNTIILNYQTPKTDNPTPQPVPRPLPIPKPITKPVPTPAPVPNPQPAPTPATEPTPEVTVVPTTKKDVLPKTGDQASAHLALGAAALVASLSLASLKKKEN